MTFGERDVCVPYKCASCVHTLKEERPNACRVQTDSPTVRIFFWHFYLGYIASRKFEKCFFFSLLFQSGPPSRSSGCWTPPPGWRPGSPRPPGLRPPGQPPPSPRDTWGHTGSGRGSPWSARSKEVRLHNDEIAKYSFFPSAISSRNNSVLVQKKLGSKKKKVVFKGKESRRAVYLGYHTLRLLCSSLPRKVQQALSVPTKTRTYFVQ